MSGKPVDINIFGKILRINCPSTQKDNLNKASESLNQKLQNLKERSKITNIEQLALITALNMCYEIEQEKLKTQRYEQNIKENILFLQKIIQETLIKHNSILEESNIQFE